MRLNSALFSSSRALSSFCASCWARARASCSCCSCCSRARASALSFCKVEILILLCSVCDVIKFNFSNSGLIVRLSPDNIMLLNLL